MTLAIVSETSSKPMKILALSMPTEKMELEPGDFFSWLGTFRVSNPSYHKNGMIRYGSSVAIIVAERDNEVRVRIEGRNHSEVRHLIEASIKTIGSEITNLTPTPFTIPWWEKIFRRVIEIKREMDAHSIS